MRVRYKDMSSDMYDIVFGVPQGSMLGPVLFIIYFIDIGCNINNNIKFILYAEDMSNILKSRY